MAVLCPCSSPLAWILSAGGKKLYGLHDSVSLFWMRASHVTAALRCLTFYSLCHSRLSWKPAGNMPDPHYWPHSSLLSQNIALCLGNAEEHKTEWLQGCASTHSLSEKEHLFNFFCRTDSIFPLKAIHLFPKPRNKNVLQASYMHNLWHLTFIFLGH